MTWSRCGPLTSSGYPGDEGVATYDEGMHVGYRGYESARVVPAFAFGHGMGYTTFDVSDVHVTVGEIAITVNAAARNLGERSGRFVPQVYVTSVDQPGVRALRGFDALLVGKGATHLVEITILRDDLRAFDDSTSTWQHPSRVRIELGSSSAHTLWATEVALSEA